jgi:hypothetical protein
MVMAGCLTRSSPTSAYPNPNPRQQHPVKTHHVCCCIDCRAEMRDTQLFSLAFMAWFSMCHRAIACQSIHIEVISGSSDYLSIHKQAVPAPEQKRKTRKTTCPFAMRHKRNPKKASHSPIIANSYGILALQPAVQLRPASPSFSSFLPTSTWRRCRASCGCR